MFNLGIPGRDHLVYFEDSPRRVRVVFDRETVADSRRVKLLHEYRLLPVYCFPVDNVRTGLLEPSDHVSQCGLKGEARYWMCGWVTGWPARGRNGRKRRSRECLRVAPWSPTAMAWHTHMMLALDIDPNRGDAASKRERVRDVVQREEEPKMWAFVDEVVTRLRDAGYFEDDANSDHRQLIAPLQRALARAGRGLTSDGYLAGHGVPVLPASGLDDEAASG